MCEKCENGKTFLFSFQLFVVGVVVSLKPIEITNWFCEFQADFYADDIRHNAHIQKKKRRESTVKNLLNNLFTLTTTLAKGVCVFFLGDRIQ